MIPVAKPERPIEVTKMTDMVEHIQSHSDFVTFGRALLKNLNEKPAEWENRDLAPFLEALVAWVNDMYGYYQAKGDSVPLNPSWKMLGEMLLAAKVYE